MNILIILLIWFLLSYLITRCIESLIICKEFCKDE